MRNGGLLLKKLFLYLVIAFLLFGCKAKNEGSISNTKAPQQSGVINSKRINDDEAKENAGNEAGGSLPLLPDAEKPAEKPQPTTDLNNPPPQAAEENIKPIANTVTISIKGVDGKAEILAATTITFTEGQTVFDILFDLVKEKQIQAEFAGSKKNIYIKGIDNLYEFDKGASSGWVYSVNGIFPNKSCGAYALKNGDIIELIYTTKPGEFME